MSGQPDGESLEVPDVLMLRHCESIGWAPDAPLTEHGYEQADRLGEVLHELSVDHVASSPYVRAFDSVAPFAKSRGLDIHTDARLAERRRSDRPLDNWCEWVRRSFSDLDYRAPGGESGREVARRGATILSEMLESDHELPLLSTHGQLLSFLANSLDPEFGYESANSMGFPAILRFSRTNGVVAFETLSIA